MKVMWKRAMCMMLVLILGVVSFSVERVQVKASETTIYDASLISPSGSYSGRLEDEGEAYYKVILNKSGKTTITISMNTGWGNFYFYDNEYEELGFFTIHYDSNRACNYMKQDLYLSAGTYYFKFTGDEGAYSFTMNFEASKETFAESQTDRNDVLGQAVRVFLDTKYVGQVGYGDVQDFYKFYVPFSGLISVSHCNYTNGTSSAYEILDSEGNSLEYFSGSFDRNKGYAHGTDTFSLKAGSYYLKVSGDWEGRHGFYNFTIKVKPNPAQIAETKRKKTKATIKIENQSGATGYILQYATSEKFGKVTTKTSKSRKITLTGLKKTKTYYLRARSYKVWEGKTYYGDYGSTVTMY